MVNMDLTTKEETARKGMHRCIKKKHTLQTFKDNLELLILTLPAISYFLIFHYIPMFGLVIAFKDYRYHLGILGSKWVGFRHFGFFFQSQDAWRITRNTVSYGAAFIILGIFVAITIALLLYEIRSKIAIKIYQTTMILPRFLSWVIVSYITYTLLNPLHGVLNQILAVLGRPSVQWYTQPQYWPFILTTTHIWNSFGMSSIIYYAALMGIDPTLFEAATIDGANRWQQTWHISIPSLTPLMTILSILAIGNLFRGDFGLFYQIPRDVGVLYPATDIIDTYVFRGLRSGNISMTTAIGFFQSVMGLILVVGSNIIIRRIKPENALF